MTNGKGSKRRPRAIDPETEAANWQRTFGRYEPSRIGSATPLTGNTNLQPDTSADAEGASRPTD